VSHRNSDQNIGIGLNFPTLEVVLCRFQLAIRFYSLPLHRYSIASSQPRNLAELPIRLKLYLPKRFRRRTRRGLSCGSASKAWYVRYRLYERGWL